MNTGAFSRMAGPTFSIESCCDARATVLGKRDFRSKGRRPT